VRACVFVCVNGVGVHATRSHWPSGPHTHPILNAPRMDSGVLSSSSGYLRARKGEQHGPDDTALRCPCQATRLPESAGIDSLFIRRGARHLAPTACMHTRVLAHMSGAHAWRLSPNACPGLPVVQVHGVTCGRACMSVSEDSRRLLLPIMTYL